MHFDPLDEQFGVQLNMIYFCVICWGPAPFSVPTSISKIDQFVRTYAL